MSAESYGVWYTATITFEVLAENEEQAADTAWEYATVIASSGAVDVNVKRIDS